MKKTPLNQWHHDNGGKMVSYAGWDMPVQYETGLMTEHQFTREKASLFDVSHMGEFRFEGLDALKTLEYLSPTNISKLEAGESCYSFFPNEDGGVVDDLLVYCFEKNTNYLICVNASNSEKIDEHINKFSKGFEVSITNECERWGQVAIQGPEAISIAEKVISGVSKIKRFGFSEFEFSGEKVWVARTGYTGEDGFEIFVSPEKSEELWTALLAGGAKPCGLAARDTLRLEAALNLYGNELSDDCNPFERRMGWTVDFSKADFLAKDKLVDLKEKASRKLIGMRALDRAIPRAGYEVLAGDEVVGVVTSGTMSPTLGEPIAMVWIDKKATQGEKQLKIQIRKKQVDAEVVSLPFLKKS
ncbi:MAG: glycine cleavage system aminomethyltransferase GcvT [Bdellovibrionales bacterium]